MSMCPVGFCVTKQPLQDSTAFPTQLGIGLEKVSQTNITNLLLERENTD